jgi:poly-gamma-glutamate synthesis protein (capsule biosynthesis protein)
MVTTKLSHFSEKQYLDLVKLLRDADIAFKNIEGMIHSCEGYALKPWKLGTSHIAPPSAAEELKWMGFNLVTIANNHSMDFSEDSLLAMFRALDSAGLAYAGMGQNLAQASRPTYLETKKGRVALVALSTAPSESLFSMAGNPASGVRGRPGMNGLRFNTTYVVDSNTMEDMKRILSLLSIEPSSQDTSEIPLQAEIADDEMLFLGRKFKVGDRPGVDTKANKTDVDRNLMEIRGATKQADWTIVAFHCHESASGNPDMPPPFARKFTRDCIDAGADTIICDGHHPGRGIELYRGKPIFHGLGTFIMQTSLLEAVPADNFEKYGLDPTKATLSDYSDARQRLWEFITDPWNYRGVLAKFTISDGKTKEMRLYPTDPHMEWPRWRSGRPLLAEGEVGEEILERFQKLSAHFGTKIDYENGIGIVDL